MLLLEVELKATAGLGSAALPLGALSKRENAMMRSGEVIMGGVINSGEDVLESVSSSSSPALIPSSSLDRKVDEVWEEVMVLEDRSGTMSSSVMSNGPIFSTSLMHSKLMLSWMETDTAPVTVTGNETSSDRQ